MKILVTGATGVLGRAVLPRLVAAGHEVAGLARSRQNDEIIRSLGAEPLRADLSDPRSLAAAMAGRDAVLHLATAIPPTGEARRREAWLANDRIRAEGTRALVDAALAADVRVVVYPSVTFLYPDRGDAWIDAATVPPAPVDMLRSTVVAEAEVARFAEAGAADGWRGVALRLAGLYGPSSPATAEQFRMARKGIAALGGPADAFTPMLWVDDAATALVAALERAPSGVYDVVDDEPLRQREIVAALARAVGRRRLLRPPAPLTRRLGGAVGELFVRSQHVSNRRFKEATGWAPSVPSGREGLALLARGPFAARRAVQSGWARAGLWFIALFSLGAGLWQQFAPRSFYDRFPGFGHAWVSVDGPYNEHLLRDVGGGNLALAAVAFVALARPSVPLTVAVALAGLAAQVPHFVYHLVHVGLLPTTTDRVLQTASLALLVVVPALLLVGARPVEAPMTASSSPREPAVRRPDPTTQPA